MNGLKVITFLILTLSVPVSTFPAVTTYMQGTQKEGSLEGTVLYADGKPFGNGISAPAVIATDEQGSYQSEFSKPGFGGTYEIKHLRSGIYDVLVAGPKDSRIDGSVIGPTIQYRPQRFLGVIVKAGAATRLNITMVPGKKLQTFGKPLATRAVMREGMIEGIVHTERGDPISNLIGAPWITPVGPDGQKESAKMPGPMTDGLYTLRNLKPGIYSVLVSQARDTIDSRDLVFRPQRILNVAVRPGVRTILNITLHEGEQLETILSATTTWEQISALYP